MDEGGHRVQRIVTRRLSTTHNPTAVVEALDPPVAALVWAKTLVAQASGGWGLGQRLLVRCSKLLFCVASWRRIGYMVAVLQQGSKLQGQAGRAEGEAGCPGLCSGGEPVSPCRRWRRGRHMSARRPRFCGAAWVGWEVLMGAGTQFCAGVKSRASRAVKRAHAASGGGRVGVVLAARLMLALRDCSHPPCAGKLLFEFISRFGFPVESSRGWFSGPSR